MSRTPYSRASSAGRRQRVLTLLPLALLSSAVTVHLAAPGGPAAVTAGTAVPTAAAPRTPSVASPPMTPASVSTRVASEASPSGVVPAVATADVQGIPPTALAAYQRAETVINAADESCNLSWQLLAAIGEVESHHGRFGVSQLDADGEATPPIIGVPLTGSGGTALIRDTDAGLLDGDQRFDRAVGPMQFIPSTWSVVGVDSDNDGERNPQDIDDAALAAAVYLCSGDDDLSTAPGQVVAVNRYNHSAAYVERVLTLMQQYLAGGFTGPSGSLPPVTVTTVAAGRIDDLRPNDEPRGPRGGAQQRNPNETDLQPTPPRGPRGGSGSDTDEDTDEDTDLEPVVTKIPVPGQPASVDPCGPEANVEWDGLPASDATQLWKPAGADLVVTPRTGYAFEDGSVANTFKLPDDSGVLCDGDTPEVPNDPMNPTVDWISPLNAGEEPELTPEEIAARCAEEGFVAEDGTGGFEYCLDYYVTPPSDPGATEGP